MKKEIWHQRPRMSRLANILYPALAPKEVQEEMKALAANERKTDPLTVKLKADQQSGKAKR